MSRRKQILDELAVHFNRDIVFDESEVDRAEGRRLLEYYIDLYEQEMWQPIDDLPEDSPSLVIGINKEQDGINAFVGSRNPLSKTITLPININGIEFIAHRELPKGPSSQFIRKNVIDKKKDKKPRDA